MEHSHEWLWIAYLFGAFLALFSKWGFWVHAGKFKYQKDVWTSTKEWFSIILLSEKVSWATTVGIVWVVGAVYIDKATFLWDWLKIVPLDDSIAFLFGTLMEYIAPNAVKWVVTKFGGTD